MPIHTPKLLIDYVYFKKTLFEEFSIDVTIDENIYIPDYGDVRIAIEKNTVDFHNIL